VMSIQGVLTLKEAVDFLYCESGLDIPHCTNVLALIKQMPAYLPMLTGTEYLVDSGDSACDFLLCFRISDLKSLERALRGNSQYGDRYIKEISRACDICKGNTVVINMFDHIWFECDAEPSNSLSIFLGIDHAGSLRSIKNELAKITTALELLESLYGMRGAGSDIYTIASFIIERLGRAVIYEVGFMGRSQGDAHVKLLIGQVSGDGQEEFIDKCRRMSTDIDVLLSLPDISRLAELMITTGCTVQVSVSIYADRQKYAIEFKPWYDPDQDKRFDLLWSQVRGCLELETELRWLSIPVAESQTDDGSTRIVSRLHHIKLFLRDSGRLGAKVYRDLRVSSIYWDP
jgi:hypothetical protein